MAWVGWGLTLGIAVACSRVGAEVPEGGAAIPPDAEPLVQSAREDLSERTGADPGAVAVVSVEAVDWPDASLGCPEPDRLYAQVVTPGYRIVLSADSEQHVYHASTSRVVYCPPERRRAGGLDGAAT